MYFVPQPYKCPKCKYEFKWSQNYDQLGLGFAEHYCEKCFIKFISDNVPIGIMIEKNK